MTRLRPPHHDLEESKRWIQCLLGGVSPVGGNELDEELVIDLVTDFVNDSPFTLKQLGIPHKQRAPGRAPGTGPVYDSREWEVLRKCVQSTSEEKAFKVFRAMVEHIANCPMIDCVALMKDALEQSWRMRAIEAEPNFFLKTRTEACDDAERLDRRSANALQALAASDVEMTYEEARSAIRELKRLGVRDFPNPNGSSLCLHYAAASGSSEDFQAFLDEFPGDINVLDENENSPLHFAAMSPSNGNIGLLLAAGAQVRSFDRMGWTPLKWAAKVGRPTNVLALLDTNEYTNEDVEHAFQGVEDADTKQKFLAYHAAVKARLAIATQHDSDPQSGLRPL